MVFRHMSINVYINLSVECVVDLVQLSFVVCLWVNLWEQKKSGTLVG